MRLNFSEKVFDTLALLAGGAIEASDRVLDNLSKHFEHVSFVTREAIGIWKPLDK